MSTHRDTICRVGGVVDVGVGVDEAREDVLPGRVNHLGTGWRSDAAVDPCDRLPFAEDVGRIATVGVDDVGVLDEERHECALTVGHSSIVDPRSEQADAEAGGGTVRVGEPTAR